MPKAQIIGLGRSGIAAAKLLSQDGWEVTIADAASEENLISRSNRSEFQALKAKLAQEKIKLQLGQPQLLNSADLPKLLVVSPGVPWDLPPLIEAREKKIDTIGEIELAWRYLKSVPWVGITGTNGKTTTTALIAAIFQAAGLNAPACGNIGYAACELALEKTNDQSFDWIVAELSSYQIESSEQLSPQIGVWTTFTPDHLSRHKTLENYYKIKASLLHRSRHKIFNGDDPYLRKVGEEQWQNAYWTSIKGKDRLICSTERGVYLEDGWVVAFGELILPISLFKMPGVHNQQNLLMAVAATKLAGIDQGAIASAIATFSGVPHRLEYIRTFKGIDFINDSKATNYDAAEVGLASVDAPVILIAGGEAKEGEDLAWIEKIKQKAATVLLIGEAAPTFAQRLTECGYNSFEIVETMANAVIRSVELAKQKNAEVVLLSPACASFDQYRSFEHRGDDFRQLCQELS
ncbi:UDP-N-acetylmuramoylalanine--D-glutamate ligase [Stanieria cyanosphaera PCC 7437]|uniref:UDP-N-acetylmuramoylalanine--D-glutamate ligase n=1 Tax=Stanieria cyanosphaera (strain ATCC 29371 / PCC 7437) TaxID=111780 RepID=K9XXL1_STAC7|nr:UDP-N-acetylmuramoyl-L-alanine--D-glutamate ligase [Stanieria cyanosphaera]AFZ36841.1 UDP-N-acetylmuramoylalanine--D-glutamate ligase [Stanieria cyanosphaera PCC 7437]